ncbi:MAG: hypothetical protein JW841_09210 [Deltaproteobacteria bacterium]|nr:hypothetical protein [Deltaproteobacteria bacterium]
MSNDESAKFINDNSNNAVSLKDFVLNEDNNDLSVLQNMSKTDFYKVQRDIDIAKLKESADIPLEKILDIHFNRVQLSENELYIVENLAKVLLQLMSRYS